MQACHAAVHIPEHYDAVGLDLLSDFYDLLVLRFLY